MALDRRPALVTGLVDFADLGAVGRDPPVETPCRLEPDPVDLSRLDHRHPEGVVVEVVILSEKEHFAILAAAVQNDMRMWMRAILVYCSNIVELRPLTLKEPLADVFRDRAHLFAAGTDGKRHQEMRGMAELGAVPLAPLVLKAPHDPVDFGLGQGLLAIMGATAVEDVARLRREIGELGLQLRAGMTAAFRDRLEDGRRIAARRAHHLRALCEPLPAARHPAPVAIEEVRPDATCALTPRHAPPLAAPDRPGPW